MKKKNVHIGAPNLTGNVVSALYLYSLGGLCVVVNTVAVIALSPLVVVEWACGRGRTS